MYVHLLWRFAVQYDVKAHTVFCRKLVWFEFVHKLIMIHEQKKVGDRNAESFSTEKYKKDPS